MKILEKYAVVKCEKCDSWKLLNRTDIDLPNNKVCGGPVRGIHKCNEFCDSTSLSEITDLENWPANSFIYVLQREYREDATRFDFNKVLTELGRDLDAKHPYMYKQAILKRFAINLLEEKLWERKK